MLYVVRSDGQITALESNNNERCSHIFIYDSIPLINIGFIQTLQCAIKVSEKNKDIKDAMTST